jgi:murein DD-endopeptidase MepM/ murein hydrolase activator NlpD
MKRTRTVFPIFAAASLLLLGVALYRTERAPMADVAIAQERVEFTRKGGGRAERQPQARAARAPAPPQQRLGARLILPVQGLTRRDLHDTWGEARSEGRRHQGIDIMAPQGRQVLAVADGRIVKFFDSERGGVTIYQFDQSERFVYYYAHLSARAAGLLEGDRVRQGQVIGYVGMTGNAPVPHLHFEILRLGAERRWWVAESMNPYPLLLTGQPPA